MSIAGCFRGLTVALVLLAMLAGIGVPAAAAGAAAPAASGKRIALVIGNSAYRNVGPLPNTANDARLIARTLQAAGFTLIGNGPEIDLDKPAFERAVQEFGQRVVGADIALFYYAGHGMQVAGENWLIPVDANPTTQRDLDFQMVDAGLVLKQMEGAGTKLNLIVLDACRNNPFLSRGIRGSAGGLAEMQAPEGTLISYATQPGNVANDGESGDSPYTLALADALRTPGLDVFRVFNQVGLAVKTATAGTQQPWLASSPIAGNLFIFNGPVTVVTNPPPPPPTQAAAAPAVAAPVPPPAPAAAAATRFDGLWNVALTCPAEHGADGYTHDFVAEVKQGALRGQFGVVGEPASLVLDGTVQADGSALLNANGRMGAARYLVEGAKDKAPGTPYFYVVDAHFDDRKGSGTRVGGPRSCSYAFARRR
ncbi:MAG TPA: caspase family protein [Stellaceae bacterium]|nr:caspase family protein [Stellaceae bacterium]